METSLSELSNLFFFKDRKTVAAFSCFLFFMSKATEKLLIIVNLFIVFFSIISTANWPLVCLVLATSANAEKTATTGEKRSQQTSFEKNIDKDERAIELEEENHICGK